MMGSSGARLADVADSLSEDAIAAVGEAVAHGRYRDAVARATERDAGPKP